MSSNAIPFLMFQNRLIILKNVINKMNSEIEAQQKDENLYLDLIVWDKNIAIKDTLLGYISILINTKKTNSRTLDKWFSLKKREKVTGEIHLQLRFVTSADFEIMKITEGKMDDVFVNNTQIEMDDTMLV